MSQSLWKDEISLEDVRRRAAEWFDHGGHEELTRALEKGAQTEREFQESAKCDLAELAKPMTDPRTIRHLRWILHDALRHASGVAARAQEATEGTDATLLFEACRKAIVDFADSHPAMQAIASASLKDRT